MVGYGGEEGKMRRRIWVDALLALVRGGLWVGAASSCLKSIAEILCYDNEALGQPASASRNGVALVVKLL